MLCLILLKCETISGHRWVQKVKQRSSAVYFFLPRRATLNLGLSQKSYVSLAFAVACFEFGSLQKMQNVVSNWKGQFGWHIFPLRSQASLLTCWWVAGISAYVAKMLWILWCIASMLLCCRNSLSCFFLSLIAWEETCGAAGCFSWLGSTVCLTSTVNSQNLNKNRRVYRSAGTALKLQVSRFKTRLPGNISTLQLRRCALFPLSHRPEGCLHITRITLVKLVNVLRAHNQTTLELNWSARTTCDYPSHFNVQSESSRTHRGSNQ